MTTKQRIRLKPAAKKTTDRPRRSREKATKEGKSVSARLSRVELEGLEAIRAELHEIGVAVNAIALAASGGRINPNHEHWAALNALRQALPEMRSCLRAVVDKQRRAIALDWSDSWRGRSEERPYHAPADLVSV